LGAHTVNHVDLGSIGLPQAHEEILGSKHALEALIGRPTTMFSFPFGKPQNISPAALDLIRNAGFKAVFSAYGGFVDSQTDLWNIPRLGANSNMRALDLMMELEGVSAGQLATRLRRLLKGRRRTTA
jgi:peptidoglycan/xylan/chitin deacetylase (PgdA/CDA1 family)